jgi:hypothetical protein
MKLLIHRSHCILRVGLSHVHGTWIEGRAQAPAAEATAEFEAAEDRVGASAAAAIQAVLGQILPRRRLASPYVSVGLSGARVRAAIAQFAKLPEDAKDRTLLISQRFCREYRLDPAAFAVSGSALGPSKTGEAVLCVAVERRLLTEIDTALGARGLYPDQISPEFMLRFAEADTRQIEAPGMALLCDVDGATVLVWDAKRTIVHLSFFSPDADGQEAERRLAARLFRYARIAGHESGPVAFYTGDGDQAAFFRRPGLLGDAVKPMRWPSGHGRWAGLL